jgi:hypothetical protein
VLLMSWPALYVATPTASLFMANSLTALFGTANYPAWAPSIQPDPLTHPVIVQINGPRRMWCPALRGGIVP